MKPLKIQMSILVTNEYLGKNGCFKSQRGPDLAWHFIAPEVHGAWVHGALETELVQSIVGLLFLLLLGEVQSCMGNLGLDMKTSCALFNCIMSWSRARTLEPAWLQILPWTLMPQFPHRRAVIALTSQAHCEDRANTHRYLEWGLACCKPSTVPSFSSPSPSCYYCCYYISVLSNPILPSGIQTSNDCCFGMSVVIGLCV